MRNTWSGFLKDAPFPLPLRRGLWFLLSLPVWLLWLPSPASASEISASPNPNGGNFTISWENPNGTGYNLLEKPTNGSTWTVIAAGWGTSHNVTNQSPGSYDYRKQFCQLSGPMAGCRQIFSNTITVTVYNQPATPSGLTAPTTDYNGAYTVSWNASSGATSYKLQERVGSGSWAQIHSGSATSKPVSGKSAGTYSYRVRACIAGTVCSNWSTTRTVTVAPQPVTPTGLTGPTTDYNGSYTVSWSPSSGSNTYQLQERLGSGSWSQIHSGSATSKAVSGNSAGSWSYRVRGCSGESVCSAWSATRTVTVATPPVTPTGLTGPSIDHNGSYTISWNSSSGSSSYRLQERVGSGSWSQIHSGSATSTAVSDKSAGSYSYRVRGCNVESVCSTWSAVHTVTVPPPPAAPTGLTGPTESMDGNYTITWNAVSGANSYRLEEKTDSGAWSQVYSGSSTSKAISGNDGGAAYTYRAKSCNAESVCGGWSSTHTVILVGNTTTYEYDELGQLIRVTHPNIITTEYDYDAAGNRVSTESSLDY